MRFLYLVLFVLLAACAQQGQVIDDFENRTGDNQSNNENQAEEQNQGEQNGEPGFMDIIGGSQEYMVEYDFSAGEQNQQMAMYKKADMQRIDAQNTRIYMNGDYITCMNQGEWMCYRIAKDEYAMPQGANTASQTESFEDSPEDYDFAFAGRRMIAGENTFCYRITGADTDVLACYTRDGIPMHTEMQAPEGEMVMTATSFSRSVSDSEFEPPAEPQDMSELMPQ